MTKEEFDRRYPQNSIQSVRQSLIDSKESKQIKENLLNLSAKNLELMRKAPNRVEAMSYYEEIATSDIRVSEIRNFKGKVIGTFCNFVPLELIYATGAIPIRLCAGAYETIYPAEGILPRDICPLVKSSLGFKILGLAYFELCDQVIIPTTCDAKKKLGEILVDILPVWMLEIPQRKNINRVRDSWLSEIKMLKKNLEQFTGVNITRDRLRGAIELLHERQAVFRQFYQLRRHNPSLINGRDSLLVLQTSFYDDINRWITKTEKLCEELKGRISNIQHLGSNIRLLLTGAPIIWPNYKLLNIIEETGAIVVCDELCSGTQALYDPVEVDEWTEEAMLRAIAYRYLLPSTCPCFTESNDRIDRLLNLVEEFKVNGVIYHNLRLCQLYDIESFKVKQVLKDKGISMLNIHTDYSQEDVGQLKTRVEAFLEMIKSQIESQMRSQIVTKKKIIEPKYYS